MALLMMTIQILLIEMIVMTYYLSEIIRTNDLRLKSIR